MNLVILLRSRVCRGWTLKGSHGYFVDEVEDMTFTVILAFSEKHFYGFIINKGTNTQQTFYHFLSKLIDASK